MVKQKELPEWGRKLLVKTHFWFNVLTDKNFREKWMHWELRE